MSIKGENARNRIIEVSKKLFTLKGYSATTMQDICREASLSRGGLYRYFSSTEEIFSEIITLEQDKAYADLEMAKEQKISPQNIMSVFLRVRLNNLTDSDLAFDNAVSEFAANSRCGKALLVKRANDSVNILSEIISEGVKSGDFNCDNPINAAKHILWTLEGMAKHNALIPLTKEEISSQCAVFKNLIGAKKDLI